MSLLPSCANLTFSHRTLTWFSDSCLHSFSCSIHPSNSLVNDLSSMPALPSAREPTSFKMAQEKPLAVSLRCDGPATLTLRLSKLSGRSPLSCVYARARMLRENERVHCAASQQFGCGRDIQLTWHRNYVLFVKRPRSYGSPVASCYHAELKRSRRKSRSKSIRERERYHTYAICTLLQLLLHVWRWTCLIFLTFSSSWTYILINSFINLLLLYPKWSRRVGCNWITFDTGR